MLMQACWCDRAPVTALGFATAGRLSLSCCKVPCSWHVHGALQDPKAYFRSAAALSSGATERLSHFWAVLLQSWRVLV